MFPLGERKNRCGPCLAADIGGLTARATRRTNAALVARPPICTSFLSRTTGGSRCLPKDSRRRSNKRPDGGLSDGGCEDGTNAPPPHGGNPGPPAGGDLAHGIGGRRRGP